MNILPQLKILTTVYDEQLDDSSFLYDDVETSNFRRGVDSRDSRKISSLLIFTSDLIVRGLMDRDV